MIYRGMYGNGAITHTLLIGCGLLNHSLLAIETYIRMSRAFSDRSRRGGGYKPK